MSTSEVALGKMACGCVHRADSGRYLITWRCCAFRSPRNSRARRLAAAQQKWDAELGTLQGQFCWTSTTYVYKSETSNEWCVGLGMATVDYPDKASTRCMGAVRMSE